MTGRPRINRDFDVGFHEERKWERYEPSKIVQVKHLRPKKEVRRKRRK